MRRRGGGSLGVDNSALRTAAMDGKVWCGVGLVVKRQDESQHYEIADGDVLVSVDLMPEGQPLWARLGGKYAWRVPPVDSEVMLAIPAGELEQMPTIVCTLSSGEVDSDLDGDMLLIVNDKKVVIKSTDDQVILGGTSGKEIARKGDETDMGTWIHQPASGSGVTACSLTYVPPGGTPTVIGGPPTGTAIKGKVNQGSSKAKAAD